MRGGQDQLSYSYALRACSPVSPTTGSALVCCPAEVHTCGEGWGLLSQVWRGGHSSPLRNRTRSPAAEFSKEQGQLSQGQGRAGSAWFQGLSALTQVTDIITDPSCSRTADPDMNFSSNLGPDITMTWMIALAMLISMALVAA